MYAIARILFVVLLLLPAGAFATPVNVDRLNNNHIEPLVKTDFIKGSYFMATSTTATSTFPVASSTKFCLGPDCRTTWPSGTGSALSTTTPWTKGFLAYVVDDATVTSVATTTLTASSPLSLSNPVVKVGGSNSVLTIATTTNSLFTGTQGHVLAYTGAGWTGVATTTFSTGLTYAAGAVTCDIASGSVFGCLASADWTTFNNKLSTAVTAIGPLAQTADGPTVTLATSSTPFNGLTASTTITGSGDTLTFTNTLAGRLGVAGGGTGAATLTGLVQGNGTSAFTVITDSSTAGQVLRVTGAAAYAWGALDLDDTDAITGDLPASNFVQGAANTVFGNPTGATADGQYFSTTTIYTGTSGQVLAKTGAGWTGVATTTFSTGLTFSGGSVTCDTASASVFGCLTSVSFSKFNSATTTFSTGVTYSAGNVTLDTASASVFGGITPAFFSKFNSATTTFSTGVTYSAGAVTCDTASASVFGCLTSAFFSKFNSATTTFGNGLTFSAGAAGLSTIAANTILANVTGATAVPTALATSSFFSLTQATTIPYASSTSFSATNASSTFSWFGTLQVFASTSLQNFTGLLATTTNATTSKFAISSLGTAAGSFLAVNAIGTVIATTTPAGGSASSTLLADTNSWTGLENFLSNTGISTTTPWGQLAINPIAGQAANKFVIGSSTATNFIVNNSGFVGVGTTSPWALLSLNAGAGQVPFAIGSSTVTVFKVESSGSTTISNLFGVNLLTLNAGSTTGPILTVQATSSLRSLFSIDQYGHLQASSTVPVLSSCGTSPSLSADSSDAWGTITVGSVAATGCTLTFGNAHVTDTHCIISNQSASVVNAGTYTESLTGFVYSQTGLTSAKLDYACFGQ